MSSHDGRQMPRLLTPAFVTLTASELLYFTALGVMIPVLPLFASDELDASATAVGAAVGVFSVSALLLRPVAGRAADRWGRRELMIVGAALFTIVVGAHLLVSTYWALVVLRVLLGVAEAVYFVAGVAALTDLAPPERLGEAISYNSIGLFLGIALGPALGEWMLGLGGFAAAWVGAAALGMGAAMLASRLPPLTPGREAGTPRAPLLPRPLVAPGLAFVTGVLGGAGFLAFASLHARDLAMTGAGGVLFAYGAIIVICRLLFASTTDRVPASTLSAAALAACALGLATMSAWATPVGLFLGAAALAVGAAFLTPAFYRVLMTRIPPSQRGGGAATFSIMVDLGLGGGPIIFGLIAGSGSITSAFAVGAALALTAAVLMLQAGMRGQAPQGSRS